MQRPQFTIRTIAFLLAGLAASQVPTALAENKSEVLETDTIDVVATTPLHSVGVAVEDVPSNVQVVKGKDIRNQQSLGIANYLSDNLLGVNVNETQNNPFQPDVNFHGFTASPLLGTPQGLSVYQDGVRINEPFGDTVNWDLITTNAISSINLMPGSNPLFGLNTLGGALSVQTKSGEHYPGGGAQVYGGSWGRRAVEGEYGGKLSNGVDYFFAGNLFKEDGWRDNSNSDVRQLFGKLGWHNDKTDIDISFSGADNDLNGNGLQSQTLMDALGRSSVYTQPDNTKNKLAFVTANLNHWISDSLAFSSVAYYRNTRSRTYNADINDDFNETPTYALTAVCDGANGVAGGDNGCVGAVNRTKTTQDSYGLTGQLSWTTEQNLLIAGLGYDRADIDFTQNRQFFTDFSATRGVGGTLDTDVNVVSLSGRTETWSVFATDTYHITPKLAATLSGRYNTTDVNNSDHLIPVAGTPGSLSGSQTFDRFNPAIGLTFTPTSSINLFGGYNEGSRAPSSIEIGCSDPATPCNLPNSMAGDPPNLKQVVAKTWEGGVRGKLSASTKWSMVAYHTTNENDIQFIANTAAGAGYFKNVGETKRLGFDLGLQTETGNFRWMAGYSFVDATYESDFDVISPANVLAGTDCQGAAAVDTICVRSGNKLAGIPKHQFKLRGEWQVIPQWSIGGTLNTFSSQYARGNENNADPAGKINSYTVVNLDTRYRFGNSGWNMFAKVNNVFDRDYSTGGALLTNMFTGAGNTFDLTATGASDRFLSPGAPRAAWIGLRYDFGGAQNSAKVDND